MNLDFLKKKIKIIDKKVFTIFKVENFFDNDFYNELEKNYPFLIPEKKIGKPHPKSGTLNHHEVQDAYGIDFRPKIGTEDMKTFNKVLEKNEILKKADEMINSNDFFNFFIKKLKLRTVFDQKNLLKKIKYLRPCKNSKEVKKKFLNKFYSNISLNYSYTSMGNEGFLRPHVDSPRKYISLLMYFPDKISNDAEYGTSFWKYKRGNYNNVPILNETDHKIFKNEAKLIFKTPFVKNCFYGFVRTDFSWHSVEPVYVGDSYIRKTLTVNFIYDN
jgi:hypothetical protein